MFTKSKVKVNALLIVGSLVAIIAPALPAFAADDAVVDNTSNQTANTGQAGNLPPASDPTPPASDPTPPTPDPEVTPPAETVILPTDQPPTDVVSTDPIVNNSVADPEPGDHTTNPDAPINVVSNTTVENNLNSEAQSGNANVDHNDSAGNATTGNANAMATILNMLQSALSFDGNGIIPFSVDIDGNLLGPGDIVIDPRILASAGTIAKKPEDNLSLSSDANAQINNNINLSATSGNAGVDHNGIGGNATTGNASALLNLINIINSMAAAHQSFIGSINIFGDFNGDILLPPELMAALAANHSSAQPSGNATINTDQSITNNISQNANTGTANIDHNGQAGNALTGNALNKLTVLNLTNRSIIGSDAILVIVNVMGNWVGLIMDAPAGTNTAILGDNSPAQSGPAVGLDNLYMNTSAHITNNINLSAQSGDASVTRNDHGGNATTGNATTAVNLVNIINSQISVSDWFGILFINVYGNWNGSFGVNTAAGGGLEDPEAPEAPFIEFIPAAETEAVEESAPVFEGAGGVSADQTEVQQTTVLGATVDDGFHGAGPSVHVNNNMLLIALGGMACFGILGAIERRNKHKRYSMDRQIIFPTTP